MEQALHQDTRGKGVVQKLPSASKSLAGLVLILAGEGLLKLLESSPVVMQLLQSCPCVLGQTQEPTSDKGPTTLRTRADADCGAKAAVKTLA